jgi:hypothetical protein
MEYALIAMRQTGQTLIVAVDRGFAKFDWVRESPLSPLMHTGSDPVVFVGGCWIY